MAQILFEEYDIRNAAKRLLKEQDDSTSRKYVGQYQREQVNLEITPEVEKKFIELQKAIGKHRKNGMTSGDEVAASLPGLKLANAKKSSFHERAGYSGANLDYLLYVVSVTDNLQDAIDYIFENQATYAEAALISRQLIDTLKQSNISSKLDVKEGLDEKEVNRKLDQFTKQITVDRNDEQSMKSILGKKNVAYQIDDRTPGKLKFNLYYPKKNGKSESCFSRKSLGKTKVDESVNVEWTDVYDLFIELACKYNDWIDREKAQRDIDALYRLHKGEHQWDEAYKRWWDNEADELDPDYPQDGVRTIRDSGKKLSEMLITKDIDLKDFEFWSGAIDTVKYLTDDEIDTIQSILEEEYPEGMNETEVNDFFWFDSDTIAEWLGYSDFEELMDRDDKDDVE